MTIDLYSWAAPNGHKVHIMLEETGLPYDVHPVNIQAGEQFDPEFLAISPNNKIPTIVDPEGPGGEPVDLFETGAILVYLGEKSGRFYPADPRARAETLCWLMFQMGSVGPMFGQNHHFRRYAPHLADDLTYPRERYAKETARLYGVMDRRLGDCEWLAGEDYAIADMATFAWVQLHERHETDLNDFPKVKRWADAMAARPGVRRGCAVLENHMAQVNADLDPKVALENFFGATQYTMR